MRTDTDSYRLGLLTTALLAVCLTLGLAPRASQAAARAALLETATATPTLSPTPTASATLSPTATATATTTASPSPSGRSTSAPSATTTHTATATPIAAAQVAPSASTPGASIVVSGTGFSPGESVGIFMSGRTTALLTVQANAGGAIAATTVALPYTTAAGQHTLTLNGQTSHRSADTALTVDAVIATLRVSPATLRAGGIVTINGGAWVTGEAITLTLSSALAPLAVIHGARHGFLPTTRLTIPLDTAPGAHTLTATGAASGRTATARLLVQSSAITVMPTTTNRGGVVTVSGGSFTTGESITITLDGVNTPLAAITATAQGAAPATGVSIPYSAPLGTQTLRLTGAHSRRSATAALTILALAPVVTPSSFTVSPGSAITVTGHDFGRQEQVTLSLNGAALSTTPSVITTTNGAFTARVTVPASLLRGANTLGAIGNQSRVSAVAQLQGVLPVSATLYFAGASTVAGEHARLPILNTAAQPAHVDLTFYYSTGAPGAASLDVPAHTRVTANLDALAGTGRVFGVKLAADRAVTAQLDLARPGQDGCGLLGVAAPATRWYLAEGYTGLSFHETLALVNPGAGSTQVRLRLLPLGGQGARTVSVTVGGESTQLVDVNSLLPGRSVSVIADAAQPIVLARTLTFSNNGYGLTAKLGVNTAATTWLFAEGTTTTRFETYLTILNPAATPALVTASFFSRTGESLGSLTITVAGLSRANIKLNDFLHASGVSSVLTSNQPVVVERPEYFGSPNAPRIAGSDVFGRNGAGVSWTFPGGATGLLREFLLLYNPSAQPVTVDATAYGSNGSVRTKTIVVAPQVRANLDVNQTFAGLTAEHGITLRSANGPGFVAEQTVFAPDFSTLQSTEGFAQ